MTHAFYGAGYTDEQIAAALAAAGLRSERHDDQELYTRVAADLAAKRVVGWFQGRFEMGPRALGNRSILSDPRDLAIKDILNARIKQREAFRPFAPAVLAERAAEYFEIEQPDPFMTMSPRVRPEKVPVIPAAVHVDGTGRIQTVDRAANPRFHALISKFAELTGVPVLLNTSFNRQEPVVASPEDAISCYLRTNMDVLVLGNHYVVDRSAEATRKAEEAHVSRQQKAVADRSLWRQLLKP
jgi:carbamoyltransferase